MSLSSGIRVGVYEIVELIGAGGMGEVYRARDTNLARDVAIKTLPDISTGDSERLARLRREAQVLASLNHPNIAAIYGLEQSNGITALVLELVEGPTLAERIAHGPIGADDALSIARQICDSLEAAHEHGIVHRDLKPANIKLRPDGTVKVLDFGLAKAIDPSTAASGSVSISPTLSSPAMSRVGIILGTAAYMSPEQAKGRNVDKRSDIWAFGCVLFEMLTRRRAFEGDDITEVLASVIKSEPDWKLLPADTPLAVRTTLKRCLQKDVRQRLRDIGDVRLALDGAFDSPQMIEAAQRSLPTSRVGRVLPWIAAVALSVLSGFLVWSMRSEQAIQVSRFEVPLPNGPVQGGGPSFAFSPDGQSLVYPAIETPGRGRLMRRHMTSLQAEPIPGSEGAETAPFFSPDGAWIGFVTGRGRVIRKMPASGGTAVTVAEPNVPVFTPVWEPSDKILYGTPTGIWRVASAGGAPEQVARTERAAGGPQALPDGRGIVYHINPLAGDEGSIEVMLSSGERRPLVAGMNPFYIPTGHLLFARVDGSLWAAPFDLDRMATTRDPVPLPHGALRRGRVTPSELAFAANGSLAYLPPLQTTGGSLVWVDRNGLSKPAVADAALYENPRVSPDGKRLAVAIDRDIWIIDLERATRTRLSYSERDVVAMYPTWTPDGRQVTFTRTNRDPGMPNSALVSRRVDTSDPIEELVALQGMLTTGSWSADGGKLVFAQRQGSSGSDNTWDLWILERGAEPRQRPFLATGFNEGSPSFSPNGRWIAYVSNESGRSEIYAIAYPGPGDRRIVSSGGGMEPTWSADGRTLFYRNGGAMMAVPIKDPVTLSLGAPTMLFENTSFRAGGILLPNYDVTNGPTFLMLQQPNAPPAALVIVLNWFEELKRLVPLQ